MDEKKFSLTDDEINVLTYYRRVKQNGHGDLNITLRDHVLAKIWVTQKYDVSKDNRLRETVMKAEGSV